MTRPNLDVGTVLLDLLDNQWVWTIDKPGTIRLETEDSDGRPTKGVNANVSEYITIAETGTREADWNGARTVRDDSNQASFEYATTQSRTRREDVYEELNDVAETVRDRREAAKHGYTIGDWDTVDFTITVPDEEIFNYWVIEATVRFDSTARTP